jgi:molecular chaperone GrpE
MDDNTPKNAADDDTYVIEDTGETVEEIEHEMELAAQEADDTLSRHPGDRGGASSPTAASNDEEVEQWKNRYMRALADFDNFRKRSDREKQDFFKHALAGTMREILPVLDNFDRALEHAEGGDDFHKGVLLIYKQLFDALQKAGLKPVEESGVHFDPNIHEGVIREEDPSVPSHTVTAVLQKGYFLQDRLLRPAMVKVAIGGPDETDDVQ